MGGLTPGASSALAKADGRHAGARRGAPVSIGNSGGNVIATVWHSWQLPQVLWQSLGAC